MRQITFGRINVRQMWNDTVAKFCVGGYDHYVSNNLLRHVIDSLLPIIIRKLKKPREDTSFNTKRSTTRGKRGVTSCYWVYC